MDGGFQQHSVSDAASTYKNNVFRCPQPEFFSEVNASHVVIRVRSWSEVPGDAEAAGLDVFNPGTKNVFRTRCTNPLSYAYQ